jgi:hypothetical protein
VTNAIVCIRPGSRHRSCRRGLPCRSRSRRRRSRDRTRCRDRRPGRFPMRARSSPPPAMWRQRSSLQERRVEPGDRARGAVSIDRWDPRRAPPRRVDDRAVTSSGRVRDRSPVELGLVGCRDAELVESGDLDRAGPVGRAQPDREVQSKRRADLVAQESADAATVDAADALADQMPVEQCRFPVRGSRLPERRLGTRVGRTSRPSQRTGPLRARPRPRRLPGGRAGAAPLRGRLAPASSAGPQHRDPARRARPAATRRRRRTAW